MKNKGGIILNIGIDIDDTISNSYEFLFNYAQKFDIEILGKNGDINEFGDCKNPFYFSELHNWTKEETKKFLEMYYIESISSVQPKLLASEILQKLKNNGHKIILITARFELDMQNTVQELTLKWLEKYNIPYDEIILYVDDKVEIVEDKKIDIFIDDSFTNCKKIADNGIKTFLMDSKVNQKLNADNIKRVYSWPYLYNELKKVGVS